MDVTLCPSCGGRLRLVVVLSDAVSIGRYLSGVGLAAEPPAIAATRPPPQRESDLVFLSQAIPSFPDRYAIGRALLCLPSRTPIGFNSLPGPDLGFGLPQCSPVRALWLVPESQNNLEEGG